MTSKKPERNVSRMDVLKDIRGLLSASQEKTGSKEARSGDKAVPQAETAALGEEVKRYKTLAQKQLDEIEKLKIENKELLAKLEAPASSKGKPVSPGTDKSSQAITDIEARTAEMSLALSQIEGLVQLRTKELLGRLARVYQEAGQGEIAMEFRRGRDEMEVIEHLARFVQALVSE